MSFDLNKDNVIQFLRKLVLDDAVKYNYRVTGLDLLLSICGEAPVPVGCSDEGYVASILIAGNPVIISREDYDNISANLRENNKLGAIKILRAATNTGLKDSKDAVESVDNFPDAKFLTPYKPYNPVKITDW